ncbi:MAG: fimbrial protein [Pseudomonadota bacterium]
MPASNSNRVQDDEPLDPKVEAIRQKMVRLLMVSGGIMMVGLVTVLIAIVYKLNQDSTATANTGPVASPVIAGPSLLLKVPEGSTVTSSSITSQGLVITLTDRTGAQSIRLYNGDGALVRTFEIQATE